MNIWHDIRKERVKPENFVALVEISKGSKNKYELDKETGRLILDRILFTSTQYPQNYGFIPRTYAMDNDPLDVLVLSSESILPMSLVRCTPIGMMIMTDNGLPDEKIIAVCDDDPFYKDFKDLKDIPIHIMDEIRHFFSVYKMLESKPTAVENCYGKQEAMETIKNCLDRYAQIIEPEANKRFAK